MPVAARPDADRAKNPPEQPQAGGALITYTGTPVALEAAPADCRVRPELPGCKQ